jgi:hypothetical protein
MLYAKSSNRALLTREFYHNLWEPWSNSAGFAHASHRNYLVFPTITFLFFLLPAVDSFYPDPYL